MNFSISKKVFWGALQVVTKSISSNSPIPALSGIKIEVNDDSIILIGSDSDISIMKTLTSDEEDIRLLIKETGSIVLEAKYIYEIVRKIETSDLTIEIIDGALTRISSGASKFEINGLKSTEYPSIDFSKPSQQFTISSDALVSVISQTTFATSDKETRQILTGVNFKADGKKLECVATDSYRLARKAVELNSEATFNITIPAKTLNELSKIIEKVEDILICVSDRKAQFWINNNIIQTRLLEGVYPETNRLIPQQFEHELIVDGRDMMKAIDRALFIKSDGISIIKLTLNQESVILSSKSPEIGSCTEKLSLFEYVGEELSISFSGKYAYDAMKHMTAGKFHIQFSGEMKPFIIKSEKDDSILQLILPVRTYN